MPLYKLQRPGQPAQISQEMINCVAVTTLPYPKKSDKPPPYHRQNPHQRTDNWLANVAYWRTYPDAPTKIDHENPEHQHWARVWIRILRCVRRHMPPQFKIPQRRSVGVRLGKRRRR